MLNARALTYEGTLALNPDADSVLLLDHIADTLRKEKASSVDVNTGTVHFDAGLFRLVSNWNVLVPFGFGDVTADIRTGVLRYRVSFRQLTLAATVMTCGIAMFLTVSGAPTGTLLFVPFIWLWLVGGNLAIGIPRFQQFLRRALLTAPRR